jgi:geranylgeranyl pyrophosphate synthase
MRKKTGKSAFSDIKEGKKTLLMLKTMELCSEHEREILRELWWKADLTIDQAEFVRSIVKSCGALEYSYNKAVEFARKAELAIQELRTTDKQLNTDVLDYLEWIAEYMAVRRDV